MTSRKKQKKRGYPVAILVGLETDRAVLWHVFSQATRQLASVKLRHVHSDSHAEYRFYEEIVDVIRPVIREGVQSVIIAVPRDKDNARNFLNHVTEHHNWLSRKKGPNAVTFGIVVGSAKNGDEVIQLRQSAEFESVIDETTVKEGDRVVEMIRKGLNDTTGNCCVYYALRDVEDFILGSQGRVQGVLRPEYVLVTNELLNRPAEKGRILRLLQIAQNRHAKTRILAVETAAGTYISTLGGIACLAIKQN